MGPDMAAYIFNPVLWRQKKVYIYEFKASQGYIVRPFLKQNKIEGGRCNSVVEFLLSMSKALSPVCNSGEKWNGSYSVYWILFFPLVGIRMVKDDDFSCMALV